MYDKKLKDMLNQIQTEVRPTKTFALKMRFRLELKSWSLIWHRAFDKHHLKFVGVGSLIFLTLTGSVGAYAYSSPDVNVLHPLYPVKQSIENAELYFAGSPKNRIDVNLRHALKRVREAEILAENLSSSENPGVEEGVNRTLSKVEDYLDLSLADAAKEENAIEASQTLNNLQVNFKSVQERLEKLEKRENLKNRAVIKIHLKKVNDFTKSKLENVEKTSDDFKAVVSDQVDAKVKAKKTKIMLKKLAKNEKVEKNEVSNENSKVKSEPEVQKLSTVDGAGRDGVSRLSGEDKSAKKRDNFSNSEDKSKKEDKRESQIKSGFFLNTSFDSKEKSDEFKELKMRTKQSKSD